MRRRHQILVGVLLLIGAIAATMILRRATEPTGAEQVGGPRGSHGTTVADGTERETPRGALAERKLETPNRAATRPEGREMADAQSQGCIFYRVSGRVVDQATGEGAAGALVQAWRDRPPLSISGSVRDTELLEAAAVQDVRMLSDINRPRDSELIRPNPWGDRLFRQAEADGDGIFVIDDIPAHRFYLRAFGRLRVAVETPLIVIAKGRETTGVELRLDCGGELRGRVLLPRGQPAEGAKVVVGQGVDPVGAVTGSLSMRIPETTHTDAKGEFVFPAVPAPGVYMLSALHESAARSDTIKVSVNPGDTIVQDILLEVGATFDLVAQDENGRRVQDVFVRLQPSRVNMGELTMLPETFKGPGAWTDVNGTLRFEGLKEGSYRLEARHSEYMPVIGDKVTIGLGEHVSREITLAPGMKLSGTVLDPEARPITGAEVRAYPLPSLTDIRSFAASREARWHPVAEDGTFCVTGLSDGELGVSARAPGYAMAQVEAQAGESSLAIRLLPLASIEGTVVSRITGDIVREFQLDVDHKIGISMDIASMEIDARLDHPIPFRTDDGRFALRGLEAGSYKLKVHAPGHASMESDWIVLEEGEVKRGELFSLGVENLIEGSVLDEASGKPIEGVQILLRDDSCSQIGDAMMALIRSPSETTDENGLFRFGGLSAGRYHLTARHGDYADTSLNNVILAEGCACENIVLRMNRGGEVFGRVLDGDGRPIAGTMILCDDSANAMSRSTSTNEDGNYSLAGLAEGCYVITLSSGDLNLDSGTYMALTDEGLESKNVTLERGQRLRVDFCKSEHAKATLAGTVRQGGEPVEGSVVSVITEEKTPSGQGPSGTHVASTAKDGTFRITNLSPGRALLQVNKVVGPFGDTLSGQVHEIILKESGTTNVSIELPSGEIYGVVQDAATCKPLAGVVVYASLHQMSTERLVLAAVAKNYACKTRTKQDGSFALTGLDAGRYTVTAGGPDPLGATNTDHALARISDIDVMDGQRIVIDPIRMPQAAIIEGTVEDSAGQPISGVCIFLRHAGSEDDFIQRLTLVRTDVSGHFVYHGVPQGCYDVVCQGSSWGQTTVCGVNAIPAKRTNIRVTVTKGTRVLLVLKTVPKTGLADLDIELLGSEGRFPLGLGDISDLAGAMFQIPEPGVYGLGTFAPGEYRVHGTCAGREFSKAFALRGEKELRVEVSIE